MTWIEADFTNEQAKRVVMVFPDKFEMSYLEMWDLGKPSEQQHWRLCDALVKEHGGEPKAYFR